MSDREFISDEAPAHAPAARPPLSFEEVKIGAPYVSEAPGAELVNVYRKADPATQAGMDVRNTVRNIFILSRGLSDADFGDLVS